jgi:hypothetical protein
VSAAGAGALLAYYPLLFVAALLPGGQNGQTLMCWLFLVAAAISYLAEAWVPRSARHFAGHAQLAAGGRRRAVDLPGGGADRPAGPGAHTGLAAVRYLHPGLFALHCARAVYSALAIYVKQRRRLPVVTRSVDLGKLRMPGCEVWVAGKAGRDRYLRARVGVRDDSIVEVGRPPARRAAHGREPPANQMFTVLYTPTWEGWIDDQDQTSLLVMAGR